MKRILFIVVPLVLSTIACTTNRTNNYYSYDKPDQQVIVKDGNKSTWVNPMQGGASESENIYTDGDGDVTVVNNYYTDRNPYYQPVVVPWWNNVYYNGFWGGPYSGLSFGWNYYWGFNRFNYWGFNNWYSPWYRYHPGFGFGWNTYYAYGYGNHHHRNHWSNNNRARDYNRRHDNYYRSPQRRQVSSRTAISGSNSNSYNRRSSTSGLNSSRSTYNSSNRSSRSSRNTNNSNVRSSRTNSRSGSSRQPSYNKGSSSSSRSSGSGYNRSSGSSSSRSSGSSSGSSSSRRGGRR